MIGGILLTLSVGLIGYSVYKWVTINNDYFAKRGLTYLKPMFFVGNVGQFFFTSVNMVQWSLDVYLKHPKDK